MDGNDGDLQPIFHGKDLEPSETTTKKMDVSGSRYINWQGECH